jgi:hypothetical protein
MTTNKTKFRPVRAVHADLDPSADCQECPMFWAADYRTLDNAKQHVAETGHVVQVVRRVVSIYRGEPK